MGEPSAAAAGLACACVLAWFTALSVYDVRQRRLPNALTLPGAAVVLAAAAMAGRGLPACLGAAALTLLYLGVHLVAPAGMGAATSSSRSASVRSPDRSAPTPGCWRRSPPRS